MHGPIQATLLYNFAAGVGGGAPSRFQYRGISPAISGRPLAVKHSLAEGLFWTEGPDGLVHMESRVRA